MKYYILSIAFIGFTFSIKAQTNINPRYDYHQKKFLDSLRNAHKQPTVMIPPTPQILYKTTVVLLSNESENMGMSGEDTVYQMKMDNMRLLKPNKNTTRIPNAAEEKIMMAPPAENKP